VNSSVSARDRRARRSLRCKTMPGDLLYPSKTFVGSLRLATRRSPGEGYSYCITLLQEVGVQQLRCRKVRVSCQELRCGKKSSKLVAVTFSGIG